MGLVGGLVLGGLMLLVMLGAKAITRGRPGGAPPHDPNLDPATIDPRPVWLQDMAMRHDHHTASHHDQGATGGISLGGGDGMSGGGGGGGDSGGGGGHSG